MQRRIANQRGGVVVGHVNQALQLGHDLAQRVEGRAIGRDTELLADQIVIGEQRHGPGLASGHNGRRIVVAVEAERQIGNRGRQLDLNLFVLAKVGIWVERIVGIQRPGA